jgi:hypothetical protein
MCEVWNTVQRPKLCHGNSHIKEVVRFFKLNITFILRYKIMWYTVKCPTAYKLLSCPLHMYACMYIHSDVLVVVKPCA